ncbi:Deoxyribodipyrimidine photo-lyase [compost metagenome]
MDTLSGGHSSASEVLDTFLNTNLRRYDEARNVPDEAASSGLSIHLHWGHISAHEVFARLMRHEGWTPANLSSKPTGQRHGWWGASPEAESFLDELITWRELSFNTCAYLPNYDRYESLPEWAQATLDKHTADPRPVRYTLADFEAARTHDPLWNAAQRQLVREGRIHNYLRMLWGKKILEWSASPREALDTLIQLNNKYALDGRDPNSYGGIFWTLGRYDRPWGPERPIFGTIRYMSSENTARKVSVKEYLRRYAGP